MIEAIIPRLLCVDLDKTEQFYNDLLGTRTVHKSEDYLMLAIDATEIHFQLEKKLNPEENVQMLYIRVNAPILDLYSRAQQLHCPIPALGGLEHKIWGQVEFSVTDPSGSLITFGQPVGV